MSIKHVIIHVIKREKDGDRLTEQLRDKENKASGITTQLTNDLLDLFSSANLSIGEFGVDGDTESEPVFEQKLKESYDKNLKCLDFVSLTQNLAIRFRNIIVGDQLKSVKGGYLVFYQYERNGQEWLAVTILNKTDGIDVSTDLNVISSQVLDLKSLHLGAAINLTQWRSGQSSRYIRFRAGLAAEVRDYFEKFIGCQRDKEASKKETKQLKEAIHDYASNTLNLTDEQVSQKVSQAHDHIVEQQKQRQQIRLSHIANHVFPVNSVQFTQHARDQFDLPEDLVIHKATLRSYKKLSGRGKGISISFGREMLGREVKYKDSKLTFTEIPDLLRESILEELSKRGKEDES